jgi:cellulose synthase/poly-beta-1,6-N-acetylglucosamine synthase-like glycosyltransferase
VLEIAFWASVGLLFHTHVGYPLTLWLMAHVLGVGRRGYPTTEFQPGDGVLPRVSLIIAAHDEQSVIEWRVRNALALDYPRDRLEVIVASDGSADRTAELARRAGANLVLELDRRGKVAAQDAAVDRSRGELLAFSDANSPWARDALRRLVARFMDRRVGYVCGQLRLLDGGGSNQEGAYWRYEMAVRELESRLGGVTAGNGAIYAVRKIAYQQARTPLSHDLALPARLAKRGWYSVYEPAARAEEKMVTTLAGEFARKRRMANGAWDILLRGRLLSPLGYSALYAYELFSHRLLRYLTPFLHLVALGTNLALVGRGGVYVLTLAAQAAVLAAALLSAWFPARPFRLASYYVAVTASLAAGLWDRLIKGTPHAWEKAEGAR